MERSRQITIIGAGNVGANIAYFLAEQSVGDCICLYDSDTGRAAGKALDMIESQPLRRSRPHICGCDSLASIEDSHLVIVALSADMFATTSAPQEAILEQIERTLPHFSGYGGVVLVASACEGQVMRRIHDHAALPNTRLMGLGTVPHAMYGQNILGAATGIDPSQIHLLVMSGGGEDDAPIHIVADATRIAGIPLARLYPDVDVEQIVGARVRAFAADPRGNYYRIAAAAARVAAAIDSDMRRILSIASIEAMERYTLPYPPAVPAVVSASGASIALTSELPAIAALLEGAPVAPAGGQS